MVAIVMLTILVTRTCATQQWDMCSTSTTIVRCPGLAREPKMSLLTIEVEYRAAAMAASRKHVVDAANERFIPSN